MLLLFTHFIYSELKFKSTYKALGNCVDKKYLIFTTVLIVYEAKVVDQQCIAFFKSHWRLEYRKRTSKLLKVQWDHYPLFNLCMYLGFLTCTRI